MSCVTEDRASDKDAQQQDRPVAGVGDKSRYEVVGSLPTLTQGENVYGDSRLAIRYLNLTGIRYLDLEQKARAGAPVKPGTVIGQDSLLHSETSGVLA